MRRLAWKARSHHAPSSRPRAIVRFYAVAAVALACSDFPSQPDSVVNLEPVDWPTELHMTDVDTIEIHLGFRDSTQEITGLRLRWQSSNDDVLRVVQLQPAEGGSREDTLVAQRRVEVTARAAGLDTVRVVVDSGIGFEPAEWTFVTRVTEKWVAVSAGRAHTCGITVDSLTYCWGEGNAGKLGTGHLTKSLKPALVQGLGNLKFVAVSAGDESTCGMMREQATFCWGSNAEGRLGNGDELERSHFFPTSVTGPSFSSLDVGRVVCGLGEDHLAFCWGTNVDGQLGHAPGQIPPLHICVDSNPKGCSLTPLQVTPLDGTPETYGRLTVGGHHVCGLSQSPQSLVAFCWGTGSFGALGSASLTSSPTPVPVSGGLRFVVLAAGGDHTCGITTSAATYCWGANASGQLGRGTTVNAMTPDVSTPGAFTSLTAGAQHTCALTRLGEAYCWGLGSSGQLGNSSTTLQRSPVAVSGGHLFTVLSAGDFHTCGVATDGSLYCWGRGAEGQLGTDDDVNRTIPKRVIEP